MKLVVCLPVKRVSSGSNSTLRGVSLLEATRIKSICSDITGILKDYGRESKRIKSTLNNDDDVNEQLTASREKAMKRIKAIVPHHCNDHSDAVSMIVVGR